MSELLEDLVTEYRRLATAGMLHGDRALLGLALQNLVANAITYTPAGRDPEVVVAHAPPRDV